MNFRDKIASLIKRVSVSQSLPDTDRYPMTQIVYMGKTANMEILFPFGMGGRPPKDAIGLCFNVNGQEENKMGILGLPTLRFKVGEGDAWSGNPLTDSVIHYRFNGDIEIIGKNNQTITIDKDCNITISGNKTESITGTCNITVTGAVNIISSASATITAPSVSLGASGGSLKKLMTEDMISIFNGHTHPDPVSGNTGTPSATITTETTSDTKAS